MVAFAFFFFNDTATTEIYTLSLHDALPISIWVVPDLPGWPPAAAQILQDHVQPVARAGSVRSEEHTSELQSPCNLVCRLLLEKKKRKTRAAFDLVCYGAMPVSCAPRGSSGA